MKQHLQNAIFTLLERGVSQHRIHELTGIDRKTIRRYQTLYEARRADGAKSSTAATTGSGDPMVAQTPPPQNPPLPRPPALGGVPVSSFNFARSASEPHREWIEQQVRLKRNAQAIYQDLVDQYGFTASYESVKRFVRALRHVDPEQFDRLEFTAGEEAQVDYGEGAPTRDPKTGRYRRPRLFVMTLRYSRRSDLSAKTKTASNASRIRIPYRYFQDVYALKQAIGVVRDRIAHVAQRAKG